MKTALEIFVDKTETHNDSYYHFVSLAAVPIFFSIDLLYLIWLNFETYHSENKKTKLTSIVVSDLINSSLCQRVTNNLFYIDKDYQESLRKNVPSEIKDEIAYLVTEYAQQNKASLTKNIYNAYATWAKGRLDKDEMEKEIIEQIQKSKTDIEKVNHLLLYYSSLPSSSHESLESTNVRLEFAENAYEDGVLKIPLPNQLLDKVIEHKTISEEKYIELNEYKTADIFFNQIKENNNIIDNNVDGNCFITSNVSKFIISDSKIRNLHINSFTGSIIIRKQSKLNDIYIFNSNIINIYIEDGCRLNDIYIGESSIIKINVKNGCRLNDIYMNNVKIEDFYIKNTRINHIYGSKSYINFIHIQSSKVKCLNLKKGEIIRLKITDSNINKLFTEDTSLVSMTFNSSSIEDTKFVNTISKQLAIINQEITQLLNLVALKSLETLSLDNNNISGEVLNWTNFNLQAIFVQNNNIEDISFLHTSKELENVFFSNTNIMDISCLEDSYNIKFLNFSHNNIYDASYLKNLIQLQKLDISYNIISDISFLKSLIRISELDLNDNEISDLSSFKYLSNLQYLDLSNNRIEHFPLEIISNNPNLEKINLKGNPIKNIPKEFFEVYKNCLENLKQFINESDRGEVDIVTKLILENLETKEPHLDLRNHDIKNLESFKKLLECTHLETLNLSRNKISDISVLSELKNLTNLEFIGNQISDISVLSKFKSLTKLDVSFNQISDISSLSKLENLTNLDLSDNQISDISALSELKKLTELDLRNNQISDISALSELKKLVDLFLDDNQISDISALSELKNLIELYLSNNYISDISALSELKNIPMLSLNNNNILDISVLSKLKKLTYLFLNDNQISDISALSELKNLIELNLSENQISDISALFELKKLTYLDFSNNQISDISALSKFKALITLKLYSNQILDLSTLSELNKLANLDLSFNQISDISPILDLPNLKKLYLKGNPIENIAKEIYDFDGNCLNELKKYIDELDEEEFKHEINEAIKFTENLRKLDLPKETRKGILNAMREFLSKQKWENFTNDDIENIKLAYRYIKTLKIGKFFNTIYKVNLSKNDKIFLDECYKVINNDYYHNSVVSDLELFTKSLIDKYTLSKNSLNKNIGIISLIKAGEIDVSYEIRQLREKGSVNIKIRSYLDRVDQYIALRASIDQATKERNNAKSMEYELGLGQKLQNLYGFIVNTLYLAETLSKINPTTDKLKQAIALFEEGKILEADKVLNETDLDQNNLLFFIDYQEKKIQKEAEISKNLIISESDEVDIVTKLVLENIKTKEPYLDLSNYDIQNLENFKKISECTHLETLDLSQNNISDISLLSNLINLQELNINDNKVIDIAPLAKLDLRVLYLSQNNIESIEPLKNLVYLNELYIPHNNISIVDYSFISSFKHLHNLYLEGNPIENIPKEIYDIDENCLSEIRKYFENLELNQITKETDINNTKKSSLNELVEKNLTTKQRHLDLSNLLSSEKNKLKQISKLYHLEVLSIRNSQISDISFLANLKELYSLELLGNHILDTFYLSNLKKLKFLNLSFNKITNASFLADLEKLESLELSANNISDISFLSSLNHLSSLNISGNIISNISMLSSLSELISLNISSNKISHTYDISELKKLKSLNISGNLVSDTYFLSELRTLSFLDASHNKISNVYFLSELTNIEYLNLAGNQIKVISFLLNLPNLKELYLKGNPIENIPQEIYDFDGNCLNKLKNYLEEDVNPNFKEVLENGWEGFNIEGSDKSRDTQEEIHRVINIANESLITANYVKYFNYMDKLIISELEEDYANIKKEFTSNNLSNEKLKKFTEDVKWRLITRVEDRMSKNALRELTKYERERVIEENLATKDRYLDLSHQEIEDLSILTPHKHLEVLRLEYNYIRDIAPVLELPNLKELYLKGNPVENIPQEVYDFEGNCLERIREYLNDALRWLKESTKETNLSGEKKWDKVLENKARELEILIEKGLFKELFDYLDLYFKDKLDYQYSNIKQEILFLSEIGVYIPDVKMRSLESFLSTEKLEEAIISIEQEKEENELNQEEVIPYGIQSEIEGIKRAIDLLLEKQEFLLEEYQTETGKARFGLKKDLEEIEEKFKEYRQKIQTLEDENPSNSELKELDTKIQKAIQEIEETLNNSTSTIKETYLSKNKITTQLLKRQKYLESIRNEKSKYKIDNVTNKTNRIDMEVVLEDISQAYTLEEIANEIRKQQKYAEKTLFIGFWIEYQMKGTGYWATATFEPNLSFKIQGMQIDEELEIIKSLIKNYSKKETFLGIWTDVWGKNYISISFEEGAYLQVRHYVNISKTSIIYNNDNVFTWNNSYNEQAIIQNDKLEFYAENGNRLFDSFTSIFSLPIGKLQSDNTKKILDDLCNKLVDFREYYSEFIKNSQINFNKNKEATLSKILNQYLDKIENITLVENSTYFADKVKYDPDFVLKIKDQLVVLELKNLGTVDKYFKSSFSKQTDKFRKNTVDSLNKLAQYMKAVEADLGILYIFDNNFPNSNISSILQRKVIFEEKEYVVQVILA